MTGVWAEIWHTIGPRFDTVQSTGKGVWQEDQLLPMHRHGFTEECYFTFSPVRGEGDEAQVSSTPSLRPPSARLANAESAR